MEQNFTEMEDFAITKDMKKAYQRETYLTALLNNIFDIVEKQLLVVDEKEFMKIFMLYHVNKSIEIFPVTPEATVKQDPPSSNSRFKSLSNLFGKPNPKVQKALGEAQNLYPAGNKG